MTVAELRNQLHGGSTPEKTRLLGKILREGRERDVWLFTTPNETSDNWKATSAAAVPSGSSSSASGALPVSSRRNCTLRACCAP
jgi:hypothetical protein